MKFTKSGAIKRGEYMELNQTAQKVSKSKRRKERLVFVGGFFKAFTAPKDNETDQEAINRYRLNHRNEFEREDGSVVPIKYQK
jgi:hypothetical protein